MKRRRTFIGVLTMGLLLVLVAGLGPVSSEAANAHRSLANRGDDSYNALAIGVPWEDIGQAPEGYDAGAVNVLYSSASGLSDLGDQLWHQDASGIVGQAENSDTFGAALAAGDFNGDGYTDLAVGIPGQDVDSAFGAGAVHILYSSAGRLSAVGDEMWHQDSTGVEGGVEVGDGFGYALAAGDFNGDAYDDLAIGVPYEDHSTENNSGAVNVLYGSSDGLSEAGDQIWDQDDFYASSTEPGDLFGYALAVGYFDADGYADLAVGAPGEDWGATANTGSVNVLYGTSTGLSDAGGETWNQNDLYIDDSVEAFDQFGHALAAGDFDNDGYDDLAVGVPGESVEGKSSAGAVNVLYSASTGLLSVGSEFWHQDTTYVPDGPESGDRFGFALAAGDFDGNGCADLAVGVPYEGIGLVAEAGAVNVLYGTTSGLSAALPQFWHQDIWTGTAGAEENDRFGLVLAGGDFDGDGYDDLAIGVPYEDVDTKGDAGAVNVVYGFGSGLGRNLQFWHQDSPGISGAAEESDGFGSALVAIPTVKRKVYLPLALRNP